VGPTVKVTGYRRLATMLGLVALGLGVGFAFRHLVVQVPELAWVCGGAAKPWWCGVREGFIAVLRWQGVGIMAVVAGAVALLRRPAAAAQAPVLAILAMAAGAAGVLLYAPELSAAGLLLGAFRLVRP